MAPVPEALAEAVAWLGVGPRRRGEALRGLLRAADRLMRSRPRRRTRLHRRFPRLHSVGRARRAGT